MCLKKDKLYKKRENEKRVMFYMINLYCKHHHKDYQKICCKTFGSKPLCKECEEIYNYSIERTDNCKFIKTKTFCSACQKQCYKRNIKNKVKQIMSFSGKIMLIYHPIIALSHVFVMMRHNFIKNKRVDFKGII